MAKGVIVDPYIMINSVDYSDYLKGFTYARGMGEGEITTSGDLAELFAPGIRTNAIGANFINDLDASLLDAPLHALWTARTLFTVVIRASRSVVSASNPEYTFTGFIKGLPFDMEIKVVPEMAVEFGMNTDVIRTTA